MTKNPDKGIGYLCDNRSLRSRHLDGYVAREGQQATIFQLTLGMKGIDWLNFFTHSVIDTDDADSKHKEDRHDPCSQKP